MTLIPRRHRRSPRRHSPNEPDRLTLNPALKIPHLNRCGPDQRLVAAQCQRNQARQKKTRVIDCSLTIHLSTAEETVASGYGSAVWNKLTAVVGSLNINVDLSNAWPFGQQDGEGLLVFLHN
jgi:hypothetical protein